MYSSLAPGILKKMQHAFDLLTPVGQNQVISIAPSPG